MSFAYDPFGRRIKKVSNAGTSIYACDGDNLIEETNSSGAVVARYSQGLNIDEPLAMLRSSTTSYYEADGLGSITSLSSGAGSLAQTYTFDSFGKTTNSSGSLTNPFQYTGARIRPRNQPLLLSRQILRPDDRQIHRSGSPRVLSRRKFLCVREQQSGFATRSDWIVSMPVLYK